MQIQISWLLKKPTDLDLHCLQRQGISGLSRTRVKIGAYKIGSTLQWVSGMHSRIKNHGRVIHLMQCFPFVCMKNESLRTSVHIQIVILSFHREQFPKVEAVFRLPGLSKQCMSTAQITE